MSQSPTTKQLDHLKNIILWINNTKVLEEPFSVTLSDKKAFFAPSTLHQIYTWWPTVFEDLNILTSAGLLKIVEKDGEPAYQVTEEGINTAKNHV